LRILVADQLPASAINALEAAGHDVHVNPDLTSDTLPAAIDGYEVLVVRSTAVPAAVIEAGKQLSLIVRAGSGVNTIDVDAASAAGIYVCNVPGRNAVAVAELTMGLILALDRSIAAASNDLKSGRWDKKSYSHARGIHGASLGILGLGAVGFEVAKRAKSFGMRLFAVKKDRSPEHEAMIEDLGIELVPSLSDLAATVDVLSLHVPATGSTRGIVNADLLAQMKDGSWLINTARSDLVDEAALLDALDHRGMRAGLDVFADEPENKTGEIASALARHPNVVGTHHVGASTRQAQESVAHGMVDVINSFEQGEPIHCVNLEVGHPRAATFRIRHLDQVGVLAAILGVIRDKGLNVAEMSNKTFRGEVAAIATISVEGDLQDGLLEALTAIPEVIGVRQL
jgi:D-3-phosphoglycerate dehydrogenase